MVLITRRDAFLQAQLKPKLCIEVNVSNGCFAVLIWHPGCGQSNHKSFPIQSRHDRVLERKKGCDFGVQMTGCL